ncbi:MAG TPA: hypothetical protein VM238_13425 [Phycisphaerae bacterium]|nr:hypothetical protein [Phycisphaerae bacterium]
MRPAALVPMLGVLAALCGRLPAGEYSQTITFREPVGYTWTDELVHRDVRIPEANVAADTFALTRSDGDPVPVQVEVLEGKPDAVRRARLWMRISLPRNGQAAYRLTCRDDGRKAGQPAGGLTVRRDGDRLILSTGVAEVAIPAPSKPFPRPLDLAEAPAPLVGVRPHGAESWYGRWRLHGTGRVKEIRTTVQAAGPVRGEVRLKYVLDEPGRTYETAIRAVRGEPWIDVQETYRLGEGAQMACVLSDRLKPSEVLRLPWFIGTDGGARPAYEVRRDRLAERAREAGPVATLRPMRSQVPDGTQVCLAVGSGEGRPAVGAVMVCPGEWSRPYEQFPTVRALEGGDGVAIAFPLADGSRRWALLAGPVARFDSKGKLQALIRSHADIPLDRVLNEWVLEWKRDPARPAPHILTTHERLKRIRDEVAGGKDTAAARLVVGVVRGETAGDRHLAEFLAGRRERLPGAGPGAAMYLGRSYQDAFLAPGAYPSRLAAAIARADLSAAGRPAGDARAALLGYVFADPNYWPGFGGGWDGGAAAHHREMYGLGISAAAMLADHPHARRWMDRALGELREDLRRTMAIEDGLGRTSPGEQAAAIAEMLPLARAAQNSRLADPFAWPEWRASIEFLRHLHTPPDPRLGRRSLAPLGDTPPWQDGLGRLFGIAAAGIRKHDARTADVWQALYRHYYGDGGSGDLATDVLLADPYAPAGRLEDADWNSRALKGFGAVLRSRFGTPREAFVALKCGSAGGGDHGDALSFHFFGAGMPIALDWHSDSTVRIDQEHMHNRVSLGDDENMDAAGQLLAMETSAAGDVAVGQVRTTRLRRLPRWPEETPEGLAFPRRTLNHTARYRRLLMLVKHEAGSALEDYLVIRDEIASSEPATFNLWVLARSVRQEGQTFRFDGQLAADAVLYMARVENERVHLGRWGWPKRDASSEVPEGFRIGVDRWRQGELQQWVRAGEPPGRPFLAVLYPYRKGSESPVFQTLADGKGVRITLGQMSEEVYLATDPPKGVDGQAVIRRGGQTTVVLKKGTVPRL